MAKVKETGTAYAVKQKRSTIEPLPNPKIAVTKLLKSLKDDVTYEDIMYEVYVLEKIYRGEQELNEGKFYTHDEVKKKLSKWLK